MDRCVARLGSLLAAAALFALAGAPPAGAQVQPHGTNDYGGFRNILPPGTNGFDNLGQLALFEATGQRPKHSDDQLNMYSSLTTAAGSITQQTIPNYYKDATFGVPAGDVESTESPEPGVTIVRDKQSGVPHIYGDTRAELMFGIGYATAEDRLFFIDVLRHAGQGDLASFAGGSNVAMDESVWANEPYTQQDLQNQVNYGLSDLPNGAQIFADATSYVDGINAYINKAEQPLNELTMMPAEYLALGKTPQPFTLENLVSIATLVGGIFGQGGGQQLSNAVLYENLTRKFGPERYAVAGSPQVIAKHKAKRKAKKTKKRKHAALVARAGKSHRHVRKAKRADHSGFATFVSFDAPNDPEAPTTVHGKAFRYQTPPMPSKAVARTLALPAYGSVQYVNHVVGGAPPSNPGLPIGLVRHGRRRIGHALGPALGPAANAGPGLLAFPQNMSNALLISARDSASGHPLAVMGPQVSYFTPQILMEEDIHGPGIDADGAAFAGVNLYVELGHGQDYAWSATSSDQNIIDTFAVPLCNPAGGAASGNSDYYLLHGRCVAMQTLTGHESWTPSLADQTPAGSITLQTQRTAFGIVIARARVRVPSCRGASIPANYCDALGSQTIPVVYTNLRSTYMHELDSAAGFAQFNNPAAMRDPQDFFNAAYKIGYTFNWFYTDNKHIAYFDSGQNPVRAPHTDPLFPSWSTDTWRGYHPSADLTPASLTARQTPESAHPHVVDQSYLTSWNNKQAPGYQDGATAQEFASVYR
jgi:acyl-homoserine lactone acylase PvdQ